VCIVCETEAYILFSNGLALSSPSQKSSKMKLRDVLLRENQHCLVPEWSGKYHVPGSSTSSACECGFCSLFIEDSKNPRVLRSEDSMVLLKEILGCWMLNDTRFTQKWRTISSDLQSLKMFQFNHRSSQLGWNNNNSQYGSEHHNNLVTIGNHYLPGLMTVRVKHFLLFFVIAMHFARLSTA
jgi:hypothetical protein